MHTLVCVVRRCGATAATAACHGADLVFDRKVKLVGNDLVTIVLAPNKVDPAPCVRVPRHELWDKVGQATKEGRVDGTVVHVPGWLACWSLTGRHRAHCC